MPKTEMPAPASTQASTATTPGERIAAFLRNYYIYFVLVAVVVVLSTANLDRFELFERGNFLNPRNIINILSSDVVVACRGSGGTLSEIALALRFERPLVLLDFDPGQTFLDAAGPGPWARVATAGEAVAQVEAFLQERGRA